MDSKYEEAVKLLQENRQMRLLRIFESLDEDKKADLAKQILSINFNQMNKLYETTKHKPEILEKKLEHLKYTDKNKLSDVAKDEYTKLGENIIKNNQYAVVTMAGGQGTRLGHKGPKGTFRLDVKPEAKYLFQIFAENLIKANEKYNISLPWYIMTSTENNDETEAFFKEHNYFGYNKDDIMFFKQGNLPLISEDGDLLLDKNYSIKLASDGNGSIYKAMKVDGVLQDMENRGIKWVFIGSVDNALLNMVDPVLLGLTVHDGNQIASKSISKKDPTERVGVFCKCNGVPGVIEYSELPKELSEERDENGELLYGEAHIMCNLFTIDAIKKIAEEKLEYHVAHKKADYIDENGELIEALQPNAYKFEAFIFDAFNYFNDITILRGKREEDFAPVKNKEGNDSPQTAIELYNNYNK